MGTDLTTAIRQVGLALQDPVNGLQLLRRAGVAFDDSQKSLIKTLNEVGRTADAQKVILGELEKRFAGSAQAARNTLGGALVGLKNTFSDLFEGTKESTSGAVEAINSLNETLSDPKLKSAIDSIITSFANGAKHVGEFAGGVRVLAENFAALRNGAAAGDVVRLEDELALLESMRKSQRGIDRFRFFGKDGLVEFYNNQELDAAIKAVKERIAEAMQSLAATPTRPGAATGKPEIIPAVSQLEEIKIAVRKITDENADALRELEEETRTSTERVSAAYSRLKAALQTLLDEGKITREQFNERLQAGITDTLGLEEIDLNEIRAKYTSLKKSTTEVGEFMKGVWRGVGNSIRQTLSDAIYEWNLSWKSLLDIVRRALADILSAIITSGIAKALKSQLSSSGGSSGSGSGLASFIAGIGGALFGAASGGRMDGLRWVGEDGPELAAGSGYIYNKRQMAFAGMGGASINYAPTFNLNIQSNGDKETEQRMAAFVDRRISQSQAEFARTLHRSGVEVRG
jgi:hypothetical protein